MPRILAGTGYSQVIAFQSENKRHQKDVFGAPNRQPVLHLAHYPPNDLVIYSTARTLSSIFHG